MEKRTLTQRTADALMTYIKENQFTPGDKLPTEKELQVILGAGRNTVREAVRLLASRNILQIKQGAGTFMSSKPGMIEDPLGFSFVEDRRKLVDDLIQVRLMIEPNIAALAAQEASEEEIERLRLLMIAVEEAIENSGDFSKEDRAFHSHLARCSQNQVVSNLIPIINEGVTLFAESVDQQEYEQTKSSHRAIYQAIKNRQPMAAQQAMTYHLLYNKNRY